MIFQILNKLLTSINKRNILIKKNSFFLNHIDIQSKIIELIYKYLFPNKKKLRFKKILIIIDLLQSNKVYQTNLGGMKIKKDLFWINFSI